MRSFLLFLAISLIALVFRIIFVSTDLSKSPNWLAFAGVATSLSTGGIESSGEPSAFASGNGIDAFPAEKLAKEWRSLGFPVTHPLRASGEKIVSAWFSPGIPGLLKTFQAGLGERWGNSLLKWLGAALNSLQPGLIFLIARNFGWKLGNALWVSLLATISPVLFGTFATPTSASLCSSLLVLSVFVSVKGLSRQSSWFLLAAGFLLGTATLVDWTACFSALCILSASVFACRKFPEGWIPATLMVVGFIGIQIPWHWKLSTHNQNLPLGAVEPYSAFFLGSASPENRTSNLTERILSLSDPDAIAFLSSPDTSELNRARWFGSEGLKKITQNPGVWISKRGEATWTSLIGSPAFWSKASSNANENPFPEKSTMGKVVFFGLLMPWWLFGLLTAALFNLAFAPDFHPAKWIPIAGLTGIFASAFLFFDGWGFGFRTLAEPFLVLLCGFLFTDPNYDPGPKPVSI